MILSVGEILVDRYLKDGIKKDYAGGAPFNVAANAKFSGATVGFVGKVGFDREGETLEQFAKSIGFDFLHIAKDSYRKTTKAVVTLAPCGERYFSFERDDTADYHLSINDVPFDDLRENDILHLGSLMLSTDEGRQFTNKVIEQTRARKVHLSFDVNLREDIYSSKEEVLDSYSKTLAAADILKFSYDELLYFAQTQDFAQAVKKHMRKDLLLVITLGKDGSMYIKDGKSSIVAAPVVQTVVDTTGAGDAFWGGLLYKLDNRNWKSETEVFFNDALHYANALGAYCIQHKGAINRF